MKQTAVEFLESKMAEYLQRLYKSEIEQAKEIEKQQKGYSEEELLQILESHKDNLEFDKDIFEHDRWFEQFKKK